MEPALLRGAQPAKRAPEATVWLEWGGLGGDYRHSQSRMAGWVYPSTTTPGTPLPPLPVYTTLTAAAHRSKYGRGAQIGLETNLVGRDLRH